MQVAVKILKIVCACVTLRNWSASFHHAAIKAKRKMVSANKKSRREWTKRFRQKMHHWVETEHDDNVRDSEQWTMYHSLAGTASSMMCACVHATFIDMLCSHWLVEWTQSLGTGSRGRRAESRRSQRKKATRWPAQTCLGCSKCRSCHLQEKEEMCDEIYQ